MTYENNEIRNLLASQRATALTLYSLTEDIEGWNGLWHGLSSFEELVVIEALARFAIYGNARMCDGPAEAERILRRQLLDLADLIAAEITAGQARIDVAVDEHIAYYEEQQKFRRLAEQIEPREQQPEQPSGDPRSVA